MKDPEKLFVYGTLKDPTQLFQLLGRPVDMTPDTLRGYALTSISVDGEQYPNITPDQSGVIPGFLLHLDPKDLIVLDEYETTAYRRIQAELGSGTLAWVYVSA